MPARHRYYHSSETRRMFTITLESSSPSAGIRVHDALEPVTTIDQNMQLREISICRVETRLRIRVAVACKIAT